MKKAPKETEVHFVKNDIDPTSLEQLTFPPILWALPRHFTEIAESAFITSNSLTSQANLSGSK